MVSDRRLHTHTHIESINKFGAFTIIIVHYRDYKENCFVDNNTRELQVMHKSAFSFFQQRKKI